MHGWARLTIMALCGEKFAPKGTNHEIYPAILAGEPNNGDGHRVECLWWE